MHSTVSGSVFIICCCSSTMSILYKEDTILEIEQVGVFSVAYLEGYWALAPLWPNKFFLR